VKQFVACVLVFESSWRWTGGREAPKRERGYLKEGNRVVAYLCWEIGGFASHWSIQAFKRGLAALAYLRTVPDTAVAERLPAGTSTVPTSTALDTAVS
jgi:hypothetical protein